MFKNYLCVLLSSILVTTHGVLSHGVETRQMINKIRCTRRFSPGTCIDHNIRVWTFEFQYMNCTERLGCPQTTRTNRFRSYASCMSRCTPLVELYLQILSYGADDNDPVFFLRGGKNNQRGFQSERKSNVPDTKKIPTLPHISTSEYYDDDNPLADEALMVSAIYGHNSDNDSIDDDDEETLLEGDMDYLMGTRDSDDYFAFH